jgi:hypothetical protein
VRGPVHPGRSHIGFGRTVDIQLPHRTEERGPAVALDRDGGMNLFLREPVADRDSLGVHERPRLLGAIPRVARLREQENVMTL